MAPSPRFRFVSRLAVAAAVGFVLAVGGCERTRTVVDQSRTLSSLRGQGNAAYDAGRYFEARRHYSEYIELRPQNAEVRYRLGHSLLELDEPTAAREHLAVAHDLDPGNETYAIKLAEAIGRAQSPEDGLEFMERLARAEGGMRGHLRIGDYARGVGFADDAERAYRRAAMIDAGRSAEPHERLALFYREVGDRDRELERLRVLLHFRPNDPEVRARIRELGEVPGPSFAMSPRELDR